MAGIGLIVDSLVTLPESAFRGVPHRKVKYPVELGGSPCEDLPPEEFIAKVESTREYPRTAALRAADIVSAARALAAEGVSGVVLIHMSGAMSVPTAEAAAEAKRTLEGLPFEAVDSRSVIGGIGVLASEAAHLISTGKGLAELVETLRAAVQRIGVVVAMPDLKYLYHGGRIGAAKMLMGSLLKTIPAIAVSGKTGVVAPIGRARSVSDVNNLLLRTIRADLEAAGPGSRLRCIVEHAGNPAPAEELMRAIQAEFKCDELYLHVMSNPGITHVGPKAWSAGYLVLKAG